MSLSNIKGGRELQEVLNTLPAKVEKNIMRAALRQGANIIRDAAREKAPKDTGALRKSIKVSTTGKRGEVIARIRAGDNKAYYAHMVEYGTAPHSITVGQDGTALAVPGNPVRSVNHPGAAPKPYMRPAIDENVEAATRRVGEVIRQRLSQKHGIDVPMPAEPDDT